MQTTELYHFPDDGIFPNSKHPLVIYRTALNAASQELASLFEHRFSSHDWTNSWRGCVYDFAHYHSTTHEVLGVSAGSAVLQFGGPTAGSNVRVRKGDVMIIPAGVPHQQLEASDDFEVVGAYPEGRDWDVLRGSKQDRPAADDRIAALPIPSSDPLEGSQGQLTSIWKLI